MNYKLGQKLYKIVSDEDTGKCELDTMIVRTIRGGFVYAILKTSFTWGKRSKRAGDYGWLDPIPDWCRHKTMVGYKFKHLHTTKRAAWLQEAMTYEELIKDYSDDDEFVASAKKIVKTARSMMKRCS